MSGARGARAHQAEEFGGALRSFLEIPVELHPRTGQSKLEPFRDGWRHLRLILVYNPTFLFLVPGFAMLLAGLLLMIFVLSPVPAFGRQLYVHTLIVAALLVILGVQALGCGICALAYVVYFIGEEDEVCAGALGLADRLQDPLAVPIQVADGGVDLREC